MPMCLPWLKNQPQWPSQQTLSLSSFRARGLCMVLELLEPELEPEPGQEPQSQS